MIDQYIQTFLQEDIGDGDHSTLACVPKTNSGSANLLVKEDGILAGIEIIKRVYELFDPKIEFIQFKKDGDSIFVGDVAFKVLGASQTILTTERTVLNILQRMSAIATQTKNIVEKVKGYPVKILDTRKTTPGFRFFEKEAVRIGGGSNHRFGLFDMVMLKDNHIDYAGGVNNAIEKTKAYLSDKKLNLKIEIEVRNFDELNQVLATGGVNRIMLDNFSPSDITLALKMIPASCETEASGGITIGNVLEYAKTGIQFISIGALTHSVKSLDLSLKASSD
ncbi:MAG: carboxylating nicotinate-nucleotide diphosphorylase [Flavobacteriia bacterium]|nr:carboxylating nicotinate-nucleotide diphosphorylase [Flavobacteriia bacterium]